MRLRYEAVFIKHNIFTFFFCLNESTMNSSRTQRVRRRIPYLVFLLAVVVLVLVYGFQGFYPDSMYAFSNTVPIVVSGLAVLSSFLALRKYWDTIRSRLSRIWLSFTLGMLLWFFGELGWFVYTMVLNVEIPYPSLADIFWLVGYVPLFLALLFYVQLFQPVISRKLFFIAGFSVACVSILTFPLLIMPVLAEASEDFVMLFINLAYPSLDLMLFLESVLGLSVFTIAKVKSRVGVAWRIINAAILTIVLADMTFSYTTLNGTYYNGHPAELLFHVSYLLFALAFYVHSQEL
jgi:hypothetical protein